MRNKQTLESLEKFSSKVGSTSNKYGRVQGETLLYKGKYYKIRYVQPETLVLNTDKLFGQWGDEFPLELLR